jgi:hypothetical protein
MVGAGHRVGSRMQVPQTFRHAPPGGHHESEPRGLSDSGWCSRKTISLWKDRNEHAWPPSLPVAVDLNHPTKGK